MAKKAIRALHLLTARGVHKAPATGDFSDGGGLMLRVRAGSASWVLRYTAPTGKRREMGLGAAGLGSLAQAGQSLTAARDAAHKARELLRQGLDPLEARAHRRQAARTADELRQADSARERWTLARCARDYHARVIEPTKTDKHAAQWISSLENHVPPAIWHKPIGGVTAPELLAALLAVEPHERARNLTTDRPQETVRRVRQRLDAVFEDAIFHERCTANPAAAIKRKMREASPREKAGEFAALPYREAPALMRRLQAAVGTAARCLELALLTAARTNEVLAAEWPEFDLDAGVWVVPAEKMKAKEGHTVYLSQPAVDLMKAQKALRLDHQRMVFPSPMPGRDDKPLSNMAMRQSRQSPCTESMRARLGLYAPRTPPSVPSFLDAKQPWNHVVVATTAPPGSRCASWRPSMAPALLRDQPARQARGVGERLKRRALAWRAESPQRRVNQGCTRRCTEGSHRGQVGGQEWMQHARRSVRKQVRTEVPALGTQGAQVSKQQVSTWVSTKGGGRVAPGERAAQLASAAP